MTVGTLEWPVIGRAERLAAEDEDDTETALELIEVLIHEVLPMRDESFSFHEEPVLRDEFTCRSCHLVTHRSHLRDAIGVVCDVCVAGPAA